MSGGKYRSDLRTLPSSLISGFPSLPSLLMFDRCTSCKTASQVNAVRQGSPVRDIDDVGQRVGNPVQIAPFRGSDELANFFLEQRHS